MQRSRVLLTYGFLVALSPGCSCLQTVAECPPECADAGSEPDASAEPDAGDSGLPFDAGQTPDAGHPNDAGAPTDAGPAREWVQVVLTGDSPAPSDFNAIAYDSKRGKALLLCGKPNQADVTWEWDGATQTWTALAFTGPQYLYPSMAYDAQRDRFVLAAQDWPLGRVDVSEWDPAQPGWVHVEPPADSPIPAYRQDTNLTYTSNGLSMLFGGATDDANGDSFDETWLWNGSSWTLATPAHSPPARRFAQQAFDALRGQVWLFGGSTGFNTGQTFDDLWVWNGADWSNLATSSTPNIPPPEGPTLAHDTRVDRLVAFGDCMTSTTWEWDGTSWSAFTLSPSPSARCYGAMVYDAANDEVLLYGGVNGDPHLGSAFNLHDTWLYKLR